ncbi:hypothetical protein MYX07_05690 [Patescibacteria group bacterium AH-259-L07]|nr:hypothetical protein [Patescibacteria group bacterium AH-259-L07]
MKHIWSVLCQKSSVDIESNLLSLFDCVEEVNFVVDKTNALKDDKLVIPIEFQLVSFWIIEDVDKDNVLEIKIELLDPHKKILNHFKNKFNIKKGILRFRNRTKIKGLPVTEEGRYTFRVKQKVRDGENYKVATELPLDIKIAYKLLDINKK